MLQVNRSGRMRAHKLGFPGLVRHVWLGDKGQVRFPDKPSSSRIPLFLETVTRLEEHGISGGEPRKTSSRSLF